jgi:hypothetical protein
MIRWIAFDDETAEALVSRFRRGAAEIHQGEPVDAALAHGKPSLLVLPSSTPGRVLLARFDPKTPQAENVSTSAASEPIAHEATGFLGLTNQPVFRKRPQPVEQETKKKWWQRRSA